MQEQGGISKCVVAVMVSVRKSQTGQERQRNKMKGSICEGRKRSTKEVICTVPGLNRPLLTLAFTGVVQSCSQKRKSWHACLHD